MPGRYSSSSWDVVFGFLGICFMNLIRLDSVATGPWRGENNGKREEELIREYLRRSNSSTRIMERENRF